MAISDILKNAKKRTDSKEDETNSSSKLYNIIHDNDKVTRDGYAEKANSVFSDYSKYAEDLSKGIGSWQDNAWFGSMENRSANLATRLKDLRQDNLADDVVPDTQNDAVTDLAIQQLKYRSKLRGLETGLNKSNEMLKSSKNTYGNFASADEFNEALKQYEKNARYESMTDDELKAELEANDRRISNAREGKDNFLEELGGQLGAMLSGQPYYNTNDKIDENIKGYQRESAIINGVLTDRRLKANAERLRGMTDFDIEHNIVNAQADYDRLQELLGESVQKNVTEGGGDSAIIDQQINEASKRIEQAKADKYDRFRIIASEMQVPDEFDSSSADLKGLYKRGDQSGMFDEADMRFVDSATRRRMEYLYSEAQKTGNWDLVNAYEDIVNNQIAQEGGRELGDFVKNLPEWADALVPIVPSGVSRLASVITGEDAPVATAVSGVALGLQTAFDSAMKTVNSFSRDGDTYTYNRASEVASAYIAEDMQGVEKTLWDLWVNTGNQIPHMAVSLITKSKLAGLATMGVQVYGQAIEEGLAMGMTTSEARNYAMIDTALELGLESVLGNMPGVRGVLSEELGERLASTAKTQAAKVALSYLGGAWGEFVEEGLQEVISPVIQKLITEQNLDFSQENVIEKIGDFLYSGMIGAVSSLIMGNTVGQVADITEAMQYDIDTYKEGKQADLGKVKEFGTMLDAESNAAKLIKNLSETSSAYDIGLAIQQAHMQMSHETYETIKNKLVESGMTEADATKNAYILYQMANGETLSREAQFVLQHEDVLASVALEVFGMDSEAAKKIRQAMEIRKKGEVVDIDKRYAEMEQAIKTFDDAEAQGNATVDVVARFKKDYSSVSEDTINEYKSILDKSNRFYAESGDLRLAYYTGTIGMDETKARSLAKNISDANFKLMYNRGVIDSKSKVAPKKYTSVVRGVQYEGVDKNQLPESTKKQIAMLDALSKATGVKITIVPASTKENGHYDPVTDTVYLHENAGNLSSGTLIYTAAHEMTHFIKKWNEDGYRKLQSFVTNEVGYSRFNSMVENLMFKKFSNEKGETIKYNREQATEEVVCNMMERVLSDGEVIKRFVEKNRTLAEKVKEWLDDTIAKVKEFLSSDKVDLNIDYEADTIVDSLEDIRNLWADALEGASKRYTKTRITLSNVNQLTSKQFEEGMAEMGVAVDDASGTAAFSWKTVPKTDEEAVKMARKQAKLLSKRFEVNEDILYKQLKSQMTVSSLLFTPLYKMRLDFNGEVNEKGKPVSPIVSDGDYPQGTLDFSNICRKRLIYTAMLDAISKANPEYVFTSYDYAEIRSIMQANELEVACGLCYVEDRRQKIAQVASSFKDMLKSLKAGKNTFTFTDGTQANIQEKYSYNPNAIKQFNEASRDSYMPTIYDLTTLDGMNALRKNHKAIAEAFEKFNGLRGQGAENLYENEKEYNGQISRWTKDRVKKANDLGGLRIYSYSDFIEFHAMDIMQAIADAQNVGLKIQFYTKVPQFAKMMMNTRAKGNMSLIPLGDYGLRDKTTGKLAKDITKGIENYELAFDKVEGIDFNNPMCQEAAKTDNIGFILVGCNDTQIKLAMADDRINFIIPFHSNQEYDARLLKKTGKWVNYRDFQEDEGGKINIYTDILDAAEKEGKPIKNRRQFQEYLFKVCKERGITPRFERFLNKDANGDYVYTAGYEKMLVDYKLFDKNGNILPQETVVADFDTEFIEGMLKTYAKGESVPETVNSPKFRLAYGIINDRIKKNGRVSEHIKVKDAYTNAQLIDALNISLDGRDISMADESVNEALGLKRSVKITDPALLKRLNNDEYETTYKSFVEIDGKLYSPMATKVDGKLQNPYELGKWYQAEERPDFDKLYVKEGKNYRIASQMGINGSNADNVPLFFKLVKDNSTNPVYARYNPYEHSSNSVFNDQFSSAYKRPNLVTVEMRVPKSEEGAYKARFAKDGTGWTEWKSGNVSTELKKVGKPRDLFLSRYAMPVRIIPDAEVAKMMKEQLDGTNIVVDENVVTPSLYKELKKIGVPTKDMGVKNSYKSNGMEYTLSLQGNGFRAYNEDGAWVEFDENGNVTRTSSKTMPETDIAKAKKKISTFKTPPYDVNDVFIRFGDIPNGNVSTNYATQAKEKGLSVYDASWNFVDGTYEPYGALEGAEINYRLRNAPVYLVEGEEVGRGSDGEPVISNAKVVAELSRKNGGYEVKGNLYSLKDQEYIQAVESNDTAKLNKMVREAARKEGYTKKVYHGTDHAPFYIFDMGRDARGNRQMFFSDNKRISQTYGRNVMSLYIDTDNFLTVDAGGDWWTGFEDQITKEKASNKWWDKLNELHKKYEDAQYGYFHKNTVSYEEMVEAEKAFKEHRNTSYEDDYISGTTYTVANYAVEQGYDGVIIKNVVDTADTNVDDESTVYVIFSPERVKSADPVTYDSNGNIIPLSERFNKANPDIRYSMKGNGYDGYSMSNNARDAYSEGKMPISRWSKADIVNDIAEINPNIDVSKLSLATLRKNMLKYAEWHHTSMWYNETPFYEIDEDYVKNLTQEDVDKIPPVAAERKSSIDREKSDVADAILRQIDVILKMGVMKNESSLIKRITSGRGIEELYNEAIGKVRDEYGNKVKQWEKLPEYHWRRSSADLYNSNIDEFIAKTYGIQNRSHNSNAFKEIYKYLTSNEDIRYSFKEVTEDEIAKAKSHFGTTKNFNEAGYLLKDGEMLDFSGRHWDKAENAKYYNDERQVDHRDIDEVLNREENYAGMDDMIASGYIRLMPESYGISIGQMPTNQQISKLYDFFSKFNDDERSVDFSDENGNTIAEAVYSKSTAPSRIINDIKKFYKDGTIPKSTADRNRYLYNFKSDTARSLAPTFYSKLERTLETLPKGKYDATTILKTLQGKGVKAEELKWSGLPAYLEGKKSVTAEEMLNVARANRMQIEEVVLDYDDELGKADPNEIRDALETEAYEFFEKQGINIYAEANIVVEKKDRSYIAFAEYDDGRRVEAARYDPNERATRWRRYALDSDENYKEFMFVDPISNYTNDAMQTHWRRNGVLVHARVADQMKKGGNKYLITDGATEGKVLFVEEIQSDWHNAGHKYGYSELKSYEKDDKYNKTIDELGDKFYELVGGDRDDIEDMLADIRWEIRQNVRFNKTDERFIDHLVGEFADDEEIRSYVENYIRGVIKAEKERNSAMVAPMQDTYQDFAMKKMLRLATESDYQYIGWTTADIQDERWDDSEYHDDEDGLSGNLKGYTIEYDQQIPKFMNKFGKQFGTQVEKITLDNNEEVWAMKITPEMRNSVLYEGQPLWSLKDSTTPRQLLADAMAYASKNEAEREIIGKYTAKIEQLDKAEQKAERIRYFIRMDEQIGNGLAELNKELGTKFKTVEEAQAEYDKLRKRIANADSEILRLEAEQPIRKLLNYAKAQQRARTTQLTKERQKRTATRHKIINQLDNYYRMLTKPQKNKYVPASLVTSVIEFLETIDRASGREQEKGKARLAQMALNYEALKNDEDYKEAYDEDTAEMLKKIATQIPDKPLYEMNQEELDMVNDALTQLRTVINDSRKFIGTHIDGFDIDTREIASILARETNSTKKMNMVQQFARHFLNLGANPRVVFNALGGFQKDSYWTKMYRMLEEGTERQNQYNYDVEQIFAPILNDKAKRKEIEAYGDTSKLITLPVKDAKGNPIQMTKGMLLSVYMHLLNDDNARHLLMGGLTIPEMSRYYGNHSRQTAYSNADNRYLGGSADIKALQIETKSATEALEKAQASGDEEAIAKATERLNAVEEEYQRVADELNSMRNQLMMFIQSKMTATDSEFIHAVQDYFKYSSKRLNEVSMQAYGYKKFGVDNYFPIVVDRDWLKTDIENFGRTMDQFSVENAGFTKDRVKSRKPMMLIDIMDQVNRSKRMQSLYYGNMIPLRNFKKVYGKVTTDGYVDTPLRKVINSVYASNKEYMTGFIDRLMKNLNGQNPQNTLAWLRGKNAVSALGLNLRVAGSQAASYINALPLLDAHALAVGTSTAFKKTDIDLIDKYTKERWARSDQANTMGEATKGKSFLEKSTKLIESVDSWTINRLWYATEDYMKRHSDLKEGTEEFYKAVAEKFEEVVRVSQPMYDVIHRPDALRSENVFVRLMTMFYTQRLQNFSQIYESVGEALRTEADYKEGKATIDELKSARKNFRHNAMAVLGSAGLLTAMKTAIDLAMHRFKGYRDDDDELTWESITNATIKNFAESLASNVLFVNNLWELVDSLANDETYYGVSLGAADMIVNGSKALYNFFDSFKNAVQSGFDEKKSKVLLNRARNLAKSIGQFFGVPANNIDNIANAIYNWGYSIANGETAEDRDYFKDIFGIKY